MKVRLAVVQGPSRPILPCSGFVKKDLAHDHIESSFKCASSCRYCSTNSGYPARIRGAELDAAVAAQFGIDVKAASEARLALYDPRFLDHLRAQLDESGPDLGRGRTLMVSQLTDPLSPPIVELGIARTMLVLLLQRTQYRLRVLTKNAGVAGPDWLDLFSQYRDRVVVGLSIGSLDNEWTKAMEIDTSPPSARVRALHRLQDSGIATFAMLCPMFPEVLEGDHIERLVESMRASRVEHFWAEPFNDRSNWKAVRAAYEEGSPGYAWMTNVFEERRSDLWSAYATELYARLRAKAERENWLGKLRYLLYENDITTSDAATFADLRGVLLQSKPGADGRSKHPSFARFQAERDQ